jgi:CBS domain-containing protein
MMSTVGELMSADPLTLAPYDRLDVARALMLSSRIRHLPVVDGARVVGMVSARDLVHVALPGERRAGDVMHAPVDTARPDEPAVEAAAHLLRRRFSSLAVVERGKLVGIVTTTDLVRLASAQLGDEPVSRLMTACPLATVEPDSPIDVARLLMKVEHVRHLPVMRGQEMVGFLSDLDVLAVDPGSELTVAQAMTGEVRHFAADMRAAEAGRILVRDRLDALPVLRGAHLAGILSAFDFLQFLLS